MCEVLICKWRMYQVFRKMFNVVKTKIWVSMECVWLNFSYSKPFLIKLILSILLIIFDAWILNLY